MDTRNSINTNPAIIFTSHIFQLATSCALQKDEIRDPAEFRAIFGSNWSGSGLSRLIRNHFEPKPSWDGQSTVFFFVTSYARVGSADTETSLSTHVTSVSHVGIDFIITINLVRTNRWEISLCPQV
jgi:hypothetical protein